MHFAMGLENGEEGKNPPARSSNGSRKLPANPLVRRAIAAEADLRGGQGRAAALPNLTAECPCPPLLELLRATSMLLSSPGSSHRAPVGQPGGRRYTLLQPAATRNRSLVTKGPWPAMGVKIGLVIIGGHSSNGRILKNLSTAQPDPSCFFFYNLS
jgi:hypothetical protein